MNQTTQRPHWSGRIGFILAAAGSAIGLGNIWKFPYITGTNGGGAFVLVYLACVLLIGLPIIIAEIHLGRESQANAVSAFEILHKKGTPWRAVGLLGTLSAFLILSFYSVVGGWVLDFEMRSLLNEFATHDTEAIKGFLDSLFASPWRLVAWHTVFMALTVGIIFGGLTKGIERWNKILMPALFVLLIALLGYSFFLAGFQEALAFIFKPDFTKLTWESTLEAVGQSFFTLSLGMGAMLTYGSYLPKGKSLVGTALSIAFLDTLVALIAGIIVFSVVFTYGQTPGAGPALIFVNLPVLFKSIPGGYFVSVAFFLLVAFAALTSAISILEVVVAFITERFNIANRKTVTAITGSIAWLLGILCALSFNVLKDVKLLGRFTLFDTFDQLTSTITLPLGGLFIALFFGWILGPKAVALAIGTNKGPIAWLILWSCRIAAPVAVAIVLYFGVRGVVSVG